MHCRIPSVDCGDLRLFKTPQRPQFHLQSARTGWLQGGHLEDAGCRVARGAQRRVVPQHPPPGTPRVLRHRAVPHLQRR